MNSVQDNKKIAIIWAKFNILNFNSSMTNFAQWFLFYVGNLYLFFSSIDFGLWTFLVEVLLFIFHYCRWQILRKVSNRKWSECKRDDKRGWLHCIAHDGSLRTRIIRRWQNAHVTHSTVSASAGRQCECTGHLWKVSSHRNVLELSGIF